MWVTELNRCVHYKKWHEENKNIILIYVSHLEVNHLAIHLFQSELDRFLWCMKKGNKMCFRAKGHLLTQSHWVNDELTHHISPSGPYILI